LPGDPGHRKPSGITEWSHLKAQSSKLKAQSSKLKAQSSKLKAQSSKLKAQNADVGFRAETTHIKKPARSSEPGG
jgi:cell division protein FtsB